MAKLRQIQRGRETGIAFSSLHCESVACIEGAERERDAESPSASGSRSAPQRRTSCRRSKMPPEKRTRFLEEEFSLPSGEARRAPASASRGNPRPPPSRTPGRGRGSRSAAARRWSIDSKASGGEGGQGRKERGKEGEDIGAGRQRPPSDPPSAAAVCDFNAISGQWSMGEGGGVLRRRRRRPLGTAVRSVCAILSPVHFFLSYSCSFGVWQMVLVGFRILNPRWVTPFVSTE